MTTLKSLGVASKGLLKRGLKRALHVMSNGLIRIEDDGPTEILIQPGGFWPSGGWRPLPARKKVDNNTALLLLVDSVI
jgi:hypothetical protein